MRRKKQARPPATVVEGQDDIQIESRMQPKSFWLNGLRRENNAKVRWEAQVADAKPLSFKSIYSDSQ